MKMLNLLLNAAKMLLLVVTTLGVLKIYFDFKHINSPVKTTNKTLARINEDILIKQFEETLNMEDATVKTIYARLNPSSDTLFTAIEITNIKTDADTLYFLQQTTLDKKTRVLRSANNSKELLKNLN